MPASATQSCDPGEVVVVEAEAPADRLAVGQVEHLRRGQPLVGELQQLRRRRRAPGWSGAASGRPGAPAGRAGGRRPGAASSARRRATTSPAPNVAWISGANVSMSGHITITSRGSSVGSSASRCRIASRTTSTWRARPWQAWICDAAVVGGAVAAGVGAPGSGAPGRRSARTSAWIRAEQRRRRRSAATGWWWSTAPSGQTSCSSRASWPHDASRRLAGRAAVGRRRAPADRRLTAGSRSTGPTAPATGAGGTGGRRGRRRAPRAPRDGRPGSRVRPNSESRSGSSDDAGSARSRAHAASIRSAGPGSPIRARRRRQSSACQPAVVGGARRRRSSPRPRPQHLGPVHGVAVEEPARWRTLVSRRARRTGPAASVAAAEVDAKSASQGSPSAASTTSSSGQTARSGSHGSRSGPIPDARGDRVADEPLGGTETRRWRRRRPRLRASRRARSTAAASASARRPASARRSPPAPVHP